MNPMKERKTDGLSQIKKIKTSQKHRKQVCDQDKDISKWIARDPDNILRFRCKLCDVPLAASSVPMHMTTKMHQSKVSGMIKTKRVINNSSKRTKPNDVTMARKAELKLTAFFVEHAIASDAAEHLESLLKDCFPDSEICQEITVNEEKMKNTITNVIEPSIRSELANKLSECKFSILADEITDTSSTKTFCVIVRYFDSSNGRIQSSFWKLHQLPYQRVTARNLYREIVESFSESNIPVENIVGFGFDGCNDVMKSVVSRFKADCPGIIIVKCISHSIHLCASEACKNIPDKCETLACAAYNFLQASAKRPAKLVKFQTYLDLKPHEMLHSSQTRWLSLITVVNCILELWPALTRFINEMSPFEEDIAGGTVVLQRLLQDDFVKLYYYFLQCVLPKFNNLNACFQFSKMVTTELDAKFEELYKDILLCFIKNRYVMETELQNVDPQASDKHLNDAQMYLGVVVRTQISENPKICDNPVELRKFYFRCRLFLKVGAMEIRKRWEFRNRVMVEIAALNPKVAQNSNEHVKTPSILPLLKTLPLISTEYGLNRQQRLEDQWRKLPLKRFPEDISESNEPDVFWAKILNWRNDTDEKEFSVLARFALDALVIPHANADCERIFSNINMIKTRMRNKVLSDCQTRYQMAILSDNIKRKENGCVGFQPSTEMINGMTSTTLQGEPEPIASTSQI